MQSDISAIISDNKWVAAKSIQHIPLQPVNSDVGLLYELANGNASSALLSSQNERRCNS